MAACGTCGNTIMFGGQKVGGRTFCSEKCANDRPASDRAAQHAAPEGSKLAPMLIFIGFLLMAIVPKFFDASSVFASLVPVVGAVVLIAGVLRFIVAKLTSAKR